MGKLFSSSSSVSWRDTCADQHSNTLTLMHHIWNPISYSCAFDAHLCVVPMMHLAVHTAWSVHHKNELALRRQWWHHIRRELWVQTDHERWVAHQRPWTESVLDCTTESKPPEQLIKPVRPNLNITDPCTTYESDKISILWSNSETWTQKNQIAFMKKLWHSVDTIISKISPGVISYTLTKHYCKKS